MKLRVLAIVAVLGLLGLASAQTLRYFSWEPNITEQTNALIQQFEAAHPGVKIQFEAD